MNTIYQPLKTFGHVRANVPMAKHTTFKIGGPAQFFIEIDETGKWVELLIFLSGEGVSYFILGGGSNLLFSDSEYEAW